MENQVTQDSFLSQPHQPQPQPQGDTVDTLLLQNDEWEFNKLHKITSRRECLVQMIGNWRLVKFRKPYDTFECIECGCLLIIYKYPSFCEAKLIHSSKIKQDQEKMFHFTDELPDLPVRHCPYDE